MNNLSYKIIVDTDPHFFPNIFQVVIDGIETDYYFDAAALNKSLKEGGVWPMFVCKCGYIGCSGYYVQVDILPDEIVWSKFFALYYDYENPVENESEESFILIKNFKNEIPSVLGKPPLRFDRNSYVKLVDQMLAELPKYKEQALEYLRTKNLYDKDIRFHE